MLRAIAARLSPAVVPMGSASGLGTRAAGFTPWDADAAPGPAAENGPNGTRESSPPISTTS